MLSIVLYFQVHQPHRIKKLSLFDVGKTDYFDMDLNREIINKVSEKCYIPANQLLLKLISQFDEKFKVAFSITGTTIEQLQMFRPDVLQLFVDLAQTGNVEFIGETYYHSLAYLYDKTEFLFQVNKHLDLIKTTFGHNPTVFRNTELIYDNRVSDYIEQFANYKIILTEGADRILSWRSPLYAYKSHNNKHFMLMKYYSLSDDIAFRFSDKGWVEWPLTTEKFTSWIEKLNLLEKSNKHLYLNIFMDYETFGEHQWESTGIFQFFEHLPKQILKHKHIDFAWPSDVTDSINYIPEPISIESPISWADSERDLSAWLSNSMQYNAMETLYQLIDAAKHQNNPKILEDLRKLSTSDLFYYMCTKYFQDGDVHKYFSPYKNPESIYKYYLFAMADVEERLGV